MGGAKREHHRRMKNAAPTSLVRLCGPSFLLALLSSLTACGGGGGSAGDMAGSLRVALTDAPACGFDAVNVTVQKVRIHQSASANENDAGWTDITLTPPKRVNLLSLTNGVLEELGQTTLAAGKYQQLRLVLAANDAATPLANAVTPTGQAEDVRSRPHARRGDRQLLA